MKTYKKILLFIFIFLSILFIKNTCLGVTITYNNWEGAPSYASIPNLELPSGTNSYITIKKNDRSQVVVLVPYNTGDYIALSNKSFSGYNEVSNSLTDIKVYTSSYTTDTDTWSSWNSSTVSSVSTYSPTSTTYTFISKFNVVAYVQGLGVIGTEVLSSGIPLPDEIKLTDNIGIFNCGRFYLVYTNNKENYFVNKFSDQSNYCCSPSGSQVTFDYYTYDSTLKAFTNKSTVKSFGTSSWGYSYLYLYNKKVYIPNGSPSTQTGIGDFFDFYYTKEYISPYIGDTDEVLANIDDYEYTLIFPGSLSKNSLPIKFYISKYIDEAQAEAVFEIQLDTLSPYYKTAENDSSEYWFEVPTSLFKNYLVTDNDYLFVLLGANEYNEYSIARKVTYKGATYVPPTDEEIQTDAIINQTQKIEEQTNAIINQTEKIEEQTEVQKSIFARIGDILSYINPLSENFFAYKLIDLLIDALKSLFVPEERIFRCIF